MQVSRMDETYRNAAATVVWLGCRGDEAAEGNLEKTGNENKEGFLKGVLKTLIDDRPNTKDHSSKLISPSLIEEIVSNTYTY